MIYIRTGWVTQHREVYNSLEKTETPTHAITQGEELLINFLLQGVNTRTSSTHDSRHRGGERVGISRETTTNRNGGQYSEPLPPHNSGHRGGGGF